MKRSTITAAVLISGIFFVVLGLTSYLVLRQLVAAPARVVTSGSQALAEIARAFREGTVELRFSSYATRVSTSQRLQFLTLNERELFERIDSATVLWGTVTLPDVVAQATAPVEYTYYVDMRDAWSFQLENDVMTVVAPPIQFNEPALDASRIEYTVREDSLMRDEDEALEKLRLAITDMTHQRAADNIELVREHGRRAIVEFVRTWMSGEFPNSEHLRIEVRWAGEGLELSSPLEIERP